MLNYSIVMRANPRDPEAPKKAYGTAQYTEVMTLEKFAEHIASHGSVYHRADIEAILTLAVDCMREQLLAGQKVQLGDLGSFSAKLKSEGADSPAEYDPATHVKRIKVLWSSGKRFNNLLPEAEFNLVATRRAAKKVVKALKAGDTSVDLTDETDEGSGLN